MRKMYIKPFDVFQIMGKYFVVRVRTVFSNEITRAEYELLSPLVGSCEVEADDALAKLLERVRLVAREPLGDSDDLQHFRLLWEQNVPRIHLTYIELMVAQTCNMHCEYCYGSGGNYGHSGIMSRETAFAALDFLKRQIDEHPDEPNAEIGVVFFGGEPLMNYPLIEECTLYAETLFEGRKLAFGMTTNLTLVTDEMLDFFAAHGFSLLVSFDGPREYQSRRVLNDGGNSYDVMVDKIHQLKSKMSADHFAGHATLYYEDDRERVIAEFERLGFADYQLCGISGCMVNGVQRDDLFRFAHREAEELEALTGKFVELVRARNVPAVCQLAKNKALARQLTTALRVTALPRQLVACGSGRSMIAVSVDGTFYPCHRFVGQDEFAMGRLEQGRYNLGDFKNHIVLENPKCRACFAKYVCGGPCAAACACDAPKVKGIPSIFNADDSFCQMIKQQIMLKAYLDASLGAQDRDWLTSNKLIDAVRPFALPGQE